MQMHRIFYASKKKQILIVAHLMLVAIVNSLTPDAPMTRHKLLGINSDLMYLHSYNFIPIQSAILLYLWFDFFYGDAAVVAADTQVIFSHFWLAWFLVLLAVCRMTQRRNRNAEKNCKSFGYKLSL